MVNSYTEITFDELQVALNSQERMKIIDLRAPRSFERGHIRGAINILYTLGLDSHKSRQKNKWRWSVMWE
ncbi:rhodanese-like domain-containing protein [Paenibacillus massiliensis]|uniref:rhodanese-like domain-containing protein n=1 Tax=Paenibacillus massiliensis TaxID=225917 RepID=UPI00048BC091